MSEKAFCYYEHVGRPNSCPQGGTMQCAICTFYETKLDHAQSQIRDYQDACTQKQEIVDSETALRKEAESRLSSCLRTLAFFRSVIQSGESWSAQCQQEYDAARDVEDQYPAD